MIDANEVVAHGIRGDEELIRDLDIASSKRHERQKFAFPGGKRHEVIVVSESRDIVQSLPNALLARPMRGDWSLG